MAETGALRATKATQYGYYYEIRFAPRAIALADDTKERENEGASLVLWDPLIEKYRRTQRLFLGQETGVFLIRVDFYAHQ